MKKSLMLHLSPSKIIELGAKILGARNAAKKKDEPTKLNEDTEERIKFLEQAVYSMAQEIEGLNKDIADLKAARHGIT